MIVMRTKANENEGQEWQGISRSIKKRIDESDKRIKCQITSVKKFVKDEIDGQKVEIKQISGEIKEMEGRMKEEINSKIEELKNIMLGNKDKAGK